jgi:tripeptide aminopeptidase
MNLQHLLYELVGIDSPSGQESKLAENLSAKLASLGFQIHRDKKGNLIGLLPGKGEPILLNAHMDRVKPGRGNKPRCSNGIITSDGSTNLGADNAAGITIILEATRRIIAQKKKHPPIVVVFTVEEEIGLWGAKALDLSPYNVSQGIVVDNASEAGTLVSAGPAYIAFDLEITGRSVHPGKNIEEGINVIRVFRRARVPLGETNNGQTRINIGTLSIPGIRNAVPEKLTAQGEIRSFLDQNSLINIIEKIKQTFIRAGRCYGAKISFSTEKYADGYCVDLLEPMVQTYRAIIESRNGQFKTDRTFIFSDANVLRAIHGLKVFVVSTGVKEEHSTREAVRLSDLEMVTTDLVALLEKLGS